MRILDKIREDLVYYKQYCTIVFGSALSQSFILERSDIDIALITLNNNREANISIWESILEHIPSRYDIRIFEILPLYIQIDIIKNYLVVFGNSLEISEYFYQYRKLWEDMAPRIKENQFKNIQEKIKRIEIRKRLILTKTLGEKN